MPEPAFGLVYGAADGPGEEEHSGKMGGGLQQKVPVSYGLPPGSKGLEHWQEHWTDSDMHSMEMEMGACSREPNSAGPKGCRGLLPKRGCVREAHSRNCVACS